MNNMVNIDGNEYPLIEFNISMSASDDYCISELVVIGKVDIFSHSDITFTDPNTKRNNKIIDTIISKVVMHRFHRFDQKISYVSVGAFDWFDLFKETYPKKDPTSCKSVNYEDITIKINNNSLRNITLEFEKPTYQQIIK